MRSRGKKLIVGLVALAMAWLLETGSASPASPQQEPYKIGLISSITGFLAHMGVGIRDGALLAVERINMAGGINGHPIKLIVYDDETEPTKGVLAIKKLREVDNVLAIAGTPSTGVAIACANIVEADEVPLVTVNSSSWSVVNKPWNIPEPPTNIKRWVFKFAQDSEFQFVYIYKIWRQLGATKIAFTNVGNAMGRGFKDWAERTNEKEGFKVVIWEEFGPADTDMTTQLTKIKGTNFDLIQLCSAEVAGGLFYRQAREMGIKTPIVGNPPLAMRSICEPLGKTIDGLIVNAFKVDVGDALPARDPQRPVIIELNNLLRKKTKYNVAEYGVGAGWDAIMLLAQGLKSGRPDISNLKEARAKVREALETVKGFVGTLAVGDMPPRHELPTPQEICVIKNGRPIPSKLK